MASSSLGTLHVKGACEQAVGDCCAYRRAASVTMRRTQALVLIGYRCNVSCSVFDHGIWSESQEAKGRDCRQYVAVFGAHSLSLASDVGPLSLTHHGADETSLYCLLFVAGGFAKVPSRPMELATWDQDMTFYLQQSFELYDELIHSFSR